jgi:hypothetical protein
MSELRDKPEYLGKVFELLVANMVQKYFETAKPAKDVIFFNTSLQRK